MNLHPKTFGGTSIDDGGTHYVAKAMGDTFYNQSPVNPVYSSVADNYPTYTTQTIGPRDLTINIQMASATAHDIVDTLNAIFDVTVNAEQTLVAEDTDDGNKQWYINCKVVRVRIVGALYTVTLKAGIGLWRTVTPNSDATWNVTSSPSTHNLSFTPSGNVGAQPTITITPQSAKASGISYSRYVLMTSPWDDAVDDWFELSDGGLDTAALVSGGKAQSDGDDFLVHLNGVQIDREFGTSTHAFNQASTYIQARVPLQARIEIPLATAIASSGAITEIELSRSKDYQKAFDRLPASGKLIIGSEAFTWTAVDRKRRQLTGEITRAAFDTSMAAHSVGDTCKWLEHIIELTYGDAAAAAPSFDSTRAPIWSENSTNLSHVYTSMTDAAGLRAGRWVGDAGKSKSKGRGDTRLYTGHQTADADPATELGFYVESWKSGNRYQDEDIDATWSLYVPQGVTTVTATGEHRRTSNSWPKLTFEVSKDGKRWVTIWTESQPSDTSSWDTWDTHSAVALGSTYYYLRFHFKGSIAAGSGNYAAAELNDITLTLAAKPTITLKAESAQPYPLDVKITNVTSGEYFTLKRTIRVGQSLQVQLGPKTRACVLLDDNTTGPRIEYPLPDQTAPLHLVPGVTNQLKYEETDADDVDITVSAEDWTL